MERKELTLCCINKITTIREKKDDENKIKNKKYMVLRLGQG